MNKFKRHDKIRITSANPTFGSSSRWASHYGGEANNNIRSGDWEVHSGYRDSDGDIKVTQDGGLNTYWIREDQVELIAQTTPPTRNRVPFSGVQPLLAESWEDGNEISFS